MLLQMTENVKLKFIQELQHFEGDSILRNENYKLFLLKVNLETYEQYIQMLKILEPSTLCLTQRFHFQKFSLINL